MEQGASGRLDATHFLLICPAEIGMYVFTQTYHIAVVLLDNYLSRTVNVPRSSLQAIGATCLFIASKLEEFQCRPSEDFVESTNHSCTREDIQEI